MPKGQVNSAGSFMMGRQELSYPSLLRAIRSAVVGEGEAGQRNPSGNRFSGCREQSLARSELQFLDALLEPTTRVPQGERVALPVVEAGERGVPERMDLDGPTRQTRSRVVWNQLLQGGFCEPSSGVGIVIPVGGHQKRLLDGS